MIKSSISAVEYKYPLIFEEREISLNTYNVETLLAEKSQTIINRGLANTRMRDFYDLYEIVQRMNFSWETYKTAFHATCKKRETIFTSEKVEKELENFTIQNHTRKRRKNPGTVQKTGNPVKQGSAEGLWAENRLSGRN